MASLPQIFAQPGVPAARAPAVSPQAFGAGFFQEAEQSFRRLSEAQQLLQVQQAVDKRENLFLGRKLDMQQNPQKYAEMGAEDFFKQFHENANADDQAILQDTPFLARGHAQVLFARRRRLELEQSFNQYHQVWKDNADAQLTKTVGDLSNNLVNANTPQEAQFYSEGLDATLNAAAAAGFKRQDEIAKLKEKLYRSTIPEGIGARFINNLDFTGFDNFKKSPLWQGMPEDTKARLESREYTAYRRMNLQGEQADKEVVTAFMNKHLNEILKNPSHAEWLQRFADENEKWFTAPNLTYLRERIKALIGTPDGADEGPRHDVMSQYEQEIINNNGLSTPALAKKWTQAVHDANLGPKASDEALTKIATDLRTSNQIRQGQSAYQQHTITWNEGQARERATQALKDAFDPTKMTPEELKQDEEMRLQNALGPMAGGRNVTQDKANMLGSAVEEAGRTGGDPAAIMRRKVQEYRKSIMPQPQPTYTPAQKLLMDRAKQLESSGEKK